MATGATIIKAPDGTIYAIPDAELAAFRLEQAQPVVLQDGAGQAYSIPLSELRRFAVPAAQAAALTPEVSGYGGPGMGSCMGPSMGPTPTTTSVSSSPGTT